MHSLSATHSALDALEQRGNERVWPSTSLRHHLSVISVCDAVQIFFLIWYVPVLVGFFDEVGWCGPALVLPCEGDA